MPKDIFVLGTGLSHNGSAVILKNGKVAVGIEKERLTRLKNDGGNDSEAIQYCLDAIGITLDQISVVVQCENFLVPDHHNFLGPRLFQEYPDLPIVSISHHLAHAYSTIGTCPFEEFNILIVDGCGSPYNQCIENIKPSLENLGFSSLSSTGLICEKDSFYHYKDGRLKSLFKDFSEFDVPGNGKMNLPTTRHSIGGFYARISNYCFGNMNDAGKLMGLAPFGKNAFPDHHVFRFEDGRVFVDDKWKVLLNRPAANFEDFKEHFQYYADVAQWAQKQVETAVAYIINERSELSSDLPLCYSGGVALNAVANAKILQDKLVNELYIEPAAADNGVALGCAYYGWLESLKKPRSLHDGNTCFGKTYGQEEILAALDSSGLLKSSLFCKSIDDKCALAAKIISGRKTLGWFQEGSEFGPRALGRRSILASPFVSEMQSHINRNIKFREDFRPFAPSVLKEDVGIYFEHAFESSYMLLVDQVREPYQQLIESVCHIDRSARVQTVTPDWNHDFHNLLLKLKSESGHGLVLNTSFNRRGEPIVETPIEAMEILLKTDLDALCIGNWIVMKDIKQLTNLQARD